MMQTRIQLLLLFILLIQLFTNIATITATLDLKIQYSNNIMNESTSRLSECRFKKLNSKYLSPAIRAYIAPTVLSGKVIEKIHSNSSETIFLMHIRGFYKLHGHTFEETGLVKPLSIPYDVKLQSLTRFSSYILVRNSPGCNGMELNKSYFLFLDAIKERVDHPIKLIRRQEALTWISHNRRQKSIVLVKMPLLNMYEKPIVLNRVTKRIIEKTLCSNCTRPVSVSISKKFQKVHVNQTVRIICQFYGNPPPKIFWQKYGDRKKIFTNDKYTVNSFKNFSVLIIKSATVEDSGDYFCGARDYVSRDGKLTVDRTELQVDSLNGYKLFDKFHKTKSEANYAIISNTSKVSDKVLERVVAYVPCLTKEDICLNGGICMKSNPILETMYSKKFCRCKAEYEGPNCEIKVVTSILNFDPKDIPIELSTLWRQLSKKSPKSLQAENT